MPFCKDSKNSRKLQWYWYRRLMYIDIIAKCKKNIKYFTIVWCCRVKYSIKFWVVIGFQVGHITVCYFKLDLGCSLDLKRNACILFTFDVKKTLTIVGIGRHIDNTFSRVIAFWVELRMVKKIVQFWNTPWSF